MSDIIRGIIGRECVITCYNDMTYECRVIEADDVWIKIAEHEKKEDTTRILRLEDIDEIEICG